MNGFPADAVCQFNITVDGGNWYLVIKEAACQVHRGTATGAELRVPTQDYDPASEDGSYEPP
jgi:hypothetical protein